MIVVGVDPGTTGAVAAIDHRGHAVVADIPTRIIASLDKRKARNHIQRRVDARKLHEVLNRLIPADEVALVLIEDVQPNMRNRASAASNGSLMRTKGAIETVIELHGRCNAPEYMTPRQWRAVLGLPKVEDATANKHASLAMARELYPHAELHLAKHHNRAEALLLAHVARVSLT